MKPADRQREDRLPDRLFQALVAALDHPVFQAIRTLRHKRLAHAADAVSRSQAPPKQALRLDEAATAHLLGVLQTISAGVLYGSWRGAAAPVPQQDVFVLLDTPMTAQANLPALREAWDRNAELRDGWLREGYAAFIPLGDA